MKYDVDIVHIHNTTAPGVIAGMIYAKKKRKPIVVTHHGAEKFSNFGSVIRRISVFLYVNFLVDKIFSYADAIICPSAYFINDSRYLKKYKEKIKIVPNGINLDAFNIPISKEECRKKLKLPSETDIILFLGALIPKKAPDILLRAMSKIVKKRSDVILILAGSGIMRENLEKLSEKMGIKNNIKFVGFVEEYLKPLYYKAADIFVLPSTMSTEVFPIVLLEASASGLPMIVSDLNTFRCIIEERYNGLFAKRKNEENLADVIIYLLENKDIQKEMGKNAKKKVRDYSWEKIAEKTEKVYTDLI
jgi:glycosyltransferase involved in cell wall biosynthesis